MIVVSDTGPVTNLLQIERLNLLKELFLKIVIPTGVFAELSHIPEQRLALEELDWVEVKEAPQSELFNKLLGSLDRGEAEAIALAVDSKAELLLIDERKGRDVAADLGVRKTGTLGILIRAKEKGLLSSVKPEMDKLIKESHFRIHSELYQGILKLVNEE